MGSFIGHAIPGSFFLLAGLWWLVHVILEYKDRLKPSINSEPHRSWKSVPATRWLRKIPLEPLVKVIAGAIGICAELGRAHWSLVDKHHEFQSPNKFGHASMYGFFVFSGLVELLNFYKLTHFSREAEFTVLAAAFGAEGMLFYFHLHGRDVFDVRIHTILFMIIFMTAIVILLEACLPKHQRELFMARTVLCLTQGTWFWEIAFTIYGSHRWIAADAAEMPEKELMLDTAVVTVNICWHILGWSGVMLICCVITSCLYKRGQWSSDCLSNTSNARDNSLANARFDDEIKELDEEIGLLRDDNKCKNNGNEVTDDSVFESLS